MFLGIEIGGTKLQVGAGDGKLVGEVVRLDVYPVDGAEGVRSLIVQGVDRAISNRGLERSSIQGIGVGFGGPFDSRTGRTIKSHQIAGWEDFPLVEWCESTFGVRTAVANDSDLAGWAEAKLGAGRGAETVVYSNIGSGIGGALIRNGEIYDGQGFGVAEIGHLRITPGSFGESWNTLEDLASGWALDRIACEALYSDAATTKELAQAAKIGDRNALAAWEKAVEYWGVAFANVATLLCPNVIVVGGGVALQGDFLLNGLRAEFDRNVFAPFRDCIELKLAELGETMVVQGALLLAGKRFRSA
jgi:glucokinase